MGKLGFLAVVAAVGFIVELGLGIALKDGPTVDVGADAPDSAVGRLSGDGDVSLADYSGKWVLLNFWASWCDPCRAEAPAIEDFSRDNRRNLVVVGVDSRDNSPDAQKFAEEYDLSYELLHDGDGDLTDSYNVKGLPESFLIDPEGKIAYIYRGPVDAAILESNFMPLIEENA